VSGRAASLLAQAKVNLFLHVLGREPSGYHQIETLFCRLDLADDVTVRIPGPGRETMRTLDTAGADVGPAEENLAYRAAATSRPAVVWAVAAPTPAPCSASCAPSTPSRHQPPRCSSGPRSSAQTSRS
jgi:hypothetical protein